MMPRFLADTQVNHRISWSILRLTLEAACATTHPKACGAFLPHAVAGTDYLASRMAAGGHVPSVFGSQPRVRPFLLPWLGRKQLCEPRGLVRLRCHQGLLLAIESISPPLLLPREGREELGEPRRLVDVRRHEHLRRRRLPPPRGLRVSRERREKLCKPRGLLRLGAQQLLPHGREGRGELRWRLGAVRRRRGGERRILPLGSGDGAQEGGEEEEEAGGGHTHPF
mmetsp:Transcript_27173/g.67389  ORF Transcript_27173/g.67389 Transcript_27173/m.67389 type:complete len:225 (+) Transcript_27173:241-915(+)